MHLPAIPSRCCVLCRSVNLERTLPGNGTQASEELCEKDPQLPQGFTPLKTDIEIKPGDTLKATCMFDSTSVKQAVNAGATHNDEMCNLYLMLYSQLPYFMACYGSPQVEKHGMGGIPLEGRVEVSTPDCLCGVPSHCCTFKAWVCAVSKVFGKLSARLQVQHSKGQL